MVDGICGVGRGFLLCFLCVLMVADIIIGVTVDGSADGASTCVIRHSGQLVEVVVLVAASSSRCCRWLSAAGRVPFRRCGA